MKKTWLVWFLVFLNCGGAFAVDVEMVAIPGGTFQMGDLTGGRGESREMPMHAVTIQPFRLGKYEVTFDQWDVCSADGGCEAYRPDDRGWGRGDRPVMRISWDDAWAFIDWLNDKTGGNYRLPTEAEWEYAARAGTTTSYHWGNSMGRNRAVCAGCGSPWDMKRTAPVGSFPANGFGLHDMHGNVREWTQDCWHYSYKGAPDDGSAWIGGDDCHSHVIRGGSWYDVPAYLRSASRFWDTRSYRYFFSQGFRLAQDVQEEAQ